MEDDHTEESSDGTLARGDDHSNYTHKQEYVEVIDAVDDLKEPDYSRERERERGVYFKIQMIVLKFTCYMVTDEHYY